MRLVVRDERNEFNRQTHAYAEYRVFSSLADVAPPVEDVIVTLARCRRDERDGESGQAVCTIAIRTGSGELAAAEAVAGHVHAAIDRAASLIRRRCVSPYEHQPAAMGTASSRGALVRFDRPRNRQ